MDIISKLLVRHGFEQSLYLDQDGLIAVSKIYGIHEIYPLFSVLYKEGNNPFKIIEKMEIEQEFGRKFIVQYIPSQKRIQWVTEDAPNTFKTVFDIFDIEEEKGLEMIDFALNKKCDRELE